MDAMVRAPYVTAVAVGTIYVAILITGAFAATLGAGGRLLAGWAGEVPVSVYLAPGADLEAARAAAVAIAPDAQVEAVPPAEAMRRLRASLGEQGRVLDGLGDDALPASVDVRDPGLSLRAGPGARGPSPGGAGRGRGGRRRGLAGAARGAAWSGAGRWGSSCSRSWARPRRSWSPTPCELAVYARRDEIEIMKLVGRHQPLRGRAHPARGGHPGAPRSRAGGRHAWASPTWLLLPRVREALPLAARLVPADILPGRLLGALLLGGAVLGLVASAISLAALPAEGGRVTAALLLALALAADPRARLSELEARKAAERAAARALADRERSVLDTLEDGGARLARRRGQGPGRRGGAGPLGRPARRARSGTRASPRPATAPSVDGSARAWRRSSSWPGSGSCACWPRRRAWATW